MIMRTLALITICCCLLSACSKQKTTFDDVVDFVRKPQDDSTFNLQVHQRLRLARNIWNYENVERDREKWLKVLQNQKENIYTRMCAAHYLAGSSEEARKFLETQIESQNLRHRYNAAEAVRLHIGRDPKKQWGIDLLLKHVSSRALDGSGVNSTPPGNQFSDGDRDDIMRSPLEEFCWDLGSLNYLPAVPVLIGVLERKPSSEGAAYSLGEIGDRAAIPVLMNMLTNQLGYNGREVFALGKLKAKEAVPILINRLDNPGTKFNGNREWVLEALLAIDDKQAVAPIKRYLATNPEKRVAAVAKRLLAQFDSSDPVADLLALLAAETDKYEPGNLISALARYPTDARVLDQLSTIASTSNLAIMRRDAIHAMGEINTSKSLLFLAGLLDQKFPNDLKDERVWKSPPPTSFTEHFHKQIHWTLKNKTGKDFPPASAPWRQYLETYQSPSNAEPGAAPKP